MRALCERSFLELGCLIFSLFPVFSSVTAAAESEDSWHFQIAPYAWLAGLDGSVATLPGLPPADVDIDFYDDILGNINGAFMLVGEARKGRFGLAMDVVYTNIETDSAIPGQDFTTLTSQTTDWIVSAPGPISCGMSMPILAISGETCSPLPSAIVTWMSTMKTMDFSTMLPSMVQHWDYRGGSKGSSLTTQRVSPHITVERKA